MDPQFSPLWCTPDSTLTGQRQQQKHKRQELRMMLTDCQRKRAVTKVSLNFYLPSYCILNS